MRVQQPLGLPIHAPIRDITHTHRSIIHAYAECNYAANAVLSLRMSYAHIQRTLSRDIEMLTEMLNDAEGDVEAAKVCHPCHFLACEQARPFSAFLFMQIQYALCNCAMSISS